MSSAGQPPVWAKRLLKATLPKGPRGETVLGDLHEEFGDLPLRRGPVVALVWFVGSGLVVSAQLRYPARGWAERRGNDLRHAVRGLVRTPAFAFSVVGTLGLGIGSAAAIFSVVDGVMLRPLPFEEPNELVRVWAAHPNSGERHLDLMYADIRAYSDRVDGFAGAAGFSVAPRRLTDGAGRARRVTVARTSPGLFDVLGVTPALGEGLVGPGEATLLISDRLWSTRYGRDPNVLGRSVRLEDEPFTVVGVLPKGLEYPSDADAWRTLSPGELEDDDREVHLVGRLAKGTSLAQVAEQVAVVADGRASEDPEGNQGITAWVQPLHSTLVRDVRSGLLTLSAAVFMLLLITVANTASLLGSRSLERANDRAVRVALGATRGRLLATRVTEGMVLAALGGTAGLFLATLGLKAILSLAPPLPREDVIGLDLRTWLVMAGVSTLTGLCLGLMPLAGRTDRKPAAALSIGRSTGSLRSRRSHGTLVSVELAIATVLVALSFALFSAFRASTQHNHGFQPTGLAMIRLDSSLEPEGDEALAYIQEVADIAEAIPGVVSVGFSSHEPLEQRGFRFPVQVGDEAPPEGRDPPSATFRLVSPGFLATLGVPLLRGREPSMGEAGAFGLVVNEHFARTRLSVEMGERLVLPFLEGTVVGVVGDISPSLGEAAEPMIYAPSDAFGATPGWMAVRFTQDPSASFALLRQRLGEFDSSLLLDRSSTLDQLLVQTVAPERFLAALSAIFAALALLLSAVGVYGIASLTVAQRRRDISIRRALGASAQAVVVHVFRRFALLVASGMGVGVVGAILGGRMVESLFLGAAPGDPIVLAGVVMVLGTAALTAVAVPLTRLVRVDPRESMSEG